MTRGSSRHVALIGNGAIAQEIVRQVAQSDELTIVGALVLSDELGASSPHPLVETIDQFLKLNASLVVECAGHAAVKEYAAPILRSGSDLMIVSVGALSDEALYDLVRDEAARSRAQVHLSAGALLGIDGLSAAKRAGLDWVRLTSRKSPLAWSGAPGVEHIDLNAVLTEEVVFRGSAREAARLFPKNANVAATVALAGVGFEETIVELLADPAAERISHVLEFEGRPGRFRVEAQSLPSPDNPKTSMLTAYNIYRSIQNLGASITI